MLNTKEYLKEYWNNVILKKISPHAEFHKVEDELKEHYTLLLWAWKRFLLPLIILYLVMSVIFHTNILGSLFVSLIFFIYSNFLPDSDILVAQSEDGKESVWYEIYFLLCFAPIFLYYTIQGKSSKLYSKSHRPFHNIKTIFIWGIFLFIIGSIFWPEDLLKKIMLPLFGMAGFAFHLMVDGLLNFFWLKNRPQYPSIKR